MTQPGWYADPTGVPGRNRWWDGVAWTSATQDVATRPPKRPASRIMIIGLVSLVLMGAAVWGAVTLLNERNQPSANVSLPAMPSECPAGITNGPATGSYPLVVEDIAAYGPKDWNGPSTNYAPPFASNAWGWGHLLGEDPPWGSLAMIGMVSDDAPNDLQAAAEAMAMCYMADNYLDYVVESFQVTPVTLDGNEGIRIDADITLTLSEVPSAGPRNTLLVLESMSGRAFLMSSYPRDRPVEVAAVDSMIDGMHVAG